MFLLLFDSVLDYAPIAAGVAAIIFVYLKHRKGACEIRVMRKLALSLAGFLAGVVVLKVVTHYFILAGDPSFGALLLPPHQALSDWFFPMTAKRYLFPFIVSLAAAALAYFIAPLVNKLFKGQLFAEEDKYIIALAALIVGWPNFVMYLGAAVILTVLLSIRETLRFGIEARIVLTDALIFSILVVLLFGNIVASYLNLYMLAIFA
ncbi:MAG: hypothetical protein NUV61_01840 [Candidatus Azambacteria bacterium]|nr:hypothetical protein [Candidatus Azambacteria bacterium]